MLWGPLSRTGIALTQGFTLAAVKGAGGSGEPSEDAAAPVVQAGVGGGGQMTDFGGGADGLLMPRSERSWERLTALA